MTGHVIDQSATLTAEQTAALERVLQGFEARKGSQIAVLFVPSTAPETIEQYALRVAEQWKLWRKKIDDGAVLVVAKNDRTLRIEVGYGLEGALTDATSKRIISEVIAPRFKEGDFYGGVTAGIDRILRVVDGEPLPEPDGQSEPSGLEQFAPILLIVAVAAGRIFRAILGRIPGALAAGSAVAVVAWLISRAILIALGAGAMALLFTLIGGGLGGYGRGLAGGRFGAGGFNSGSFRGGGGSFGGGGASGRW